MADNCPEWLYTDLGIMSVAAIPNGIYTTDSARQVEYIVNDSGTRFLFVENEEQLDKALEVRGRCPDLVKIFVFDMEGLHGFQDDQVMTFEALLELGAAYDREHPEAYDRLVEIPRPEDLAILVYTSGTTGPPKGAMLSHRNILFQLEYADFITPLREGDQQLSFLPALPRGRADVHGLQPALHRRHRELRREHRHGAREHPRSRARPVLRGAADLGEVLLRAWPSACGTPPGSAASPTTGAIRIGLRLAACRIEGRRPSLALRAAFRVADFLVLDNVKRSIGLHRARGVATGAAPIAPDLIRWYLALGLDMYEVYGQTENTGLATAMPPDRIKLGTVGVARPETEVRLSPEGEILLKGPHVFMGYYGKPDKTAETVVDGWLHTGDVGTIDADGFVRITDRMKDIIITAGGKNVTPSEIENQLKFSPYISDAVVIGDQRRFLSCLVMIDHETVAQFAQERNVPFSNFTSLCRAREVQDLIWSEIERVNRELARVETIKAFRLIEQLLTAEDEELTPTMKLKRTFVNVKYKRPDRRHVRKEQRMKKLLAVSVLAAAVAFAGVATAQKETRGVTKTEIVLGMHTDLSGPAATYGVSSSNAVKMRFDEVNEAGGIHGRKIRLVIEDTQYQVPRAVQAGAKLIQRDRIFAMVAGLGTPMNNALFKDQFDAGVPNLFPLSAARSMYEPFNKLKFYGAASYVDQVRAGINYFVTQKGKKALCAMYQDTDFGKEVLDGVQAQAEKMKLKIVETVTHKPTDQDFSAQVTKLKAANCDLVVLGTIVRDSIVPYATARKMGWNDVDFLGSAASYDLFVAAAQGGVTEGLLRHGPHRHALPRHARARMPRSGSTATRTATRWIRTSGRSTGTSRRI